METLDKLQLKRDLLSSLDLNDHLTGQVIVGANLTLVEGKHWGLASTLGSFDILDNYISDAGQLQRQKIKKVLQYIYSERLMEASLGMAALNSVLDIPAGVEKRNALEEIESRVVHKNIALVGHFPFVERLKKIARNCWVFERRLQDGDLPAQLLPEYLPKTDVLVMTGQVVTNNCFLKIIAQAGHAFKIILGPSTPVSPVLFEYGIDIIGGIKITNPGAVAQFIKQGAHFKQLPGIEKILLKKNPIRE